MILLREAAGLALLVWDDDRPDDPVSPHYLRDGVTLALARVAGTLGADSAKPVSAAFIKLADPIVDDDLVVLRRRSGSVVCRYTANTLRHQQPVNAADLAERLALRHQHGLLSMMLSSVPAAFKLHNHAQYVLLLHQLMCALLPAPRALRPICQVTAEDLLLAGCHEGPDDGPYRAVLVGTGRLRQAARLPVVTAGGPEDERLHLLLPRSTIADGTSLALLSPQSVALHEIAGAEATLPAALTLLHRDDDSAARVRAALDRLYRSEPTARPMFEAARREIDALMPRKPRLVGGPKQPFGAALDLLIGNPLDGVFVSGWMNDTHELVSHMSLSDTTGRPVAIDVTGHRFRHPVVQAESAALADSARPGFVAYIGGDDIAVPRQPACGLVLRSGVTLPLTPAFRSDDPAALRHRLLSAIPQADLSEAMIGKCLAPAASALERAYQAPPKQPRLRDFGRRPTNPRASVVIPLYRNLSYLRFQLAAFAVDRDFVAAELILVLDSPEQEQAVSHLLQGLHALYGLPMRLAVMPRNCGFAAACNEGAAIAAAATLLFVNSDVLPDRSGWISGLLGALDDDPAIGAVGPKLLFEDHSLQHAGLYFGRDLQGRWRNRHYYKGYPRHYPPALERRSVPGVTGAVLAVKRALYDQVGGFAEDYIIGDFEDSDLCLRIRAAGFDIHYIPDVEMFHLERRSISSHRTHARGMASEINRWLHESRWATAMADLMRAPAEVPRLASADPLKAAG